MNSLEQRIKKTGAALLLLFAAGMAVAFTSLLAKRQDNAAAFDHMPVGRYNLLESLRAALRTAPAASGACPELETVGQGLAKMMRAALSEPRLHIDGAALRQRFLELAATDTAPVPSCRDIADQLRGFANAGHWRQLAGAGGGLRHLRPVGKASLETRNPWTALPGVLRSSEGAQLDPADTSRWLLDEFQAPTIGRSTPAQLAAHVKPLLLPSTTGATARAFGRDWPKGDDVTVSLSTLLQVSLNYDAACLVGQPPAPHGRCEAALHKRASLLAYMAIDADSGAVVAMGGAASGCALEQLERHTVVVERNSRRHVPLFATPDSDCAQLPNADSPQFTPPPVSRHGLQGEPRPAADAPFLLADCASACKPLVVAAALRAGKITHTDAAYWTETLAQSHDAGSARSQNRLQALAIDVAPQWEQVLEAAGLRAHDAPPGASGKAENPVYMPTRSMRGDPLSGGRAGLSYPLYELTFPRTSDYLPAQRYQAALADPSHPDRRSVRYLRSAALASTAIGNANIKMSVAGLASVWYALAQNAAGRTVMPAVSALAPAGGPARQERAILDQEQAGLLLKLLGQAHVSGTAAAACRQEWGAQCRALTLSSKTGTSEVECDPREDRRCAMLAFKVQPSGAQQALPAKWYGGLYTAPNGRRFAFAVMALRVRGKNDRLDDANAAALFGMRLIGHLKVDLGNST